MFRYGVAHGVTLGVIAALALPYTLVTPQSWKKPFRIPAGSDNEASPQLALATWPKHASLFARKRDHGRAEAALIAHWAGERVGALGGARRAECCPGCSPKFRPAVALIEPFQCFRCHANYAPKALSRDLLARMIAYRVQEQRLGKLGRETRKLLDRLAKGGAEPVRHLKVGTVMVREHQGTLHEVMVVPGGFSWQDKTYPSLSTIAQAITGTSWNGPRFFGLRGGSGIEAAVEPVPVMKNRSAS